MSKPRFDPTALLVYVPLAVAALYLMGANWSSGFLGEFGLSDAQFGAGFERTVLFGFLSLFKFGFTPAFWTIVSLSIFGGSISIAAQLFGSLRKRRHRRVADTNPKSNAENNGRWSAVEAFGDRVHTTAILLGVLFACTVGAVLLPLRAGQEAGQAYKAKAAKGAVAVVTTVVQDQPPISGPLVACNDVQCAYWIKDRTVIVDREKVEFSFATPAREIGGGGR